MQVDWTLLVMIAFPIWAALDYFLGRRAKIVAYLGQPASFSSEGDDFPQVRTHSVIIANVGRKEATNICLGHQVLPEFRCLFPRQDSDSTPLLYEVMPVPHGGQEIRIPLLPATQQVTISYLYPPTLSLREINTYVHSDVGSVKLQGLLPLSQYPVWLCFIAVQFLEIIPICLLVYWAITRVKF